MNIRNRFVRTIITMFAVFALLPFHVLAQDASTPAADDSDSPVLISIRPAGTVDGTRFEATANPGETVEFDAVLENYGEEPIELRTYVSDILPTVNGGLNIAPPDSERTGITTWVTYSTEEFILNPGESVNRPLIVQVPEGTPPGQYVNAVALESVNPVKVSGAFRQYFRKVITIYVTVPGDVQPGFSLGAPEILVDSGLSAVIMPIQNTGNVRLQLEVEYELSYPDGTVHTSSIMRLGVIYMGQETIISLPLVSVPPEGEYLLTYRIVDLDSQVEQSQGDIAVQAPEVEEVAGVDPIILHGVAVEPNADPIVFANVTVDIEATRDSFRSTRLTLSVYHNGELVEDFVLAENLAIQAGTTTTVTQRYLPATDWEPGTYTFSIRLESTDGGTESLLFEEEDVATLEVP